MATASTRIPKPKDWQEFERQIEVLVQCILDDPSAKGNGRQGQRQNGVDVFGWRPVKIAVGFQCKEHFDQPVTEAELRAEVKKAEKFRPKLKEFILVTTAPRDAKIQQVARLMTEERDDFSVDVWSWEDIEQKVIEHPRAIKAFDNTYSPLISQEIREMRNENSAGFDLILAEIRSQNASGSAEIAGDEDKSTERHGQITLIQSMIEEGEVAAAIPLIDRIVAKELDKASPSEIYRLKVTQANVAIKREKFDDAGLILIDAASSYPEHKTAPSNLATGYLLAGRGEEAVDAALRILQQDAENQKMADTLAQARALQGLVEPFEGIPEPLLNSAIIWGLKCNLARMSGDESWRQIAKDGLAEHPEDKFLKRFAAEATVDECISAAPAFTIGEPSGSVSRENVDIAATELFEQIGALRSIGGEVPAALAHNAALACRLADRFEDALQILSAAVEEHPSERELLEQLAMHHVHHGDPAKAVAYLEGINRSAEGNLTLASAYIATDRFDDAWVSLEKLEFPVEGVTPQVHFLAVYFEWFRRQRRLSDANQMFSKLSEEHPESLPLILFRIKVLRMAGDEEGYEKALDEGLERAGDDTSFGVVYELAEEAFKGQKFEEVVQLLKDRVSTDHENQPLSLCIAAAVNGNMHNTASELLSKVPEKVADERWYRRVAVSIENRIGSDRTLPLLNAYLRDYPDDAEMRTARIGLWQTNGDIGKVRNDLKKTRFESLTGTPFSLMQFYRIATNYSDGSISVPLAYKLLLENWDNVDCHTGYHGIFLSNEYIAGIDRAPGKVGINCVFRVQTEKHGERWYRIEEERPAIFGEEWLSPSDDLAKSLLGKAVGDAIKINGAFEDYDLTILEIKSCYLDTFHRSISKFQHRFPNSGAMFQLSIDTEAEDPFVELKQMVRRMSERDEELLNLYRDNPIPIVWLARVLGKDEIECSVGLPADLGIPFRVCQGTREEREAALSVIQNNGKRGVIVDAVTAVVIKRLGVEDAVEAVCGEIRTTATTIERLTERFHEAEAMIGRQMGSFAYRNGQFCLTEYSEEQQRGALEVRAKELEWAREKLVIVPSMPRSELDPDAKQMTELVGMRAVAPSLAANGADLPLLADDFGIRLWSKAALNVDGLWLQPVLMRARDDGHLSVEAYAKAVIAMADVGFSYISFDGPTLLHALREAKFETEAVRKPLQILLGKPADLSQNLLIAMSVLASLEGEGCPLLAIHKFASEIARAATYPRWGQAREILRAIASAPVPFIREHLESWYWWNSIGSR